MHNCSSCSKEVNDVSRLINGKCFNCTYLEQLAKTKLVVQEHNLKVAKVEDCIPQPNSKIPKKTKEVHLAPHNPLPRKENSSGDSFKFVDPSPEENASLERKEQQAECISCGVRVKLVLLMRGLCQPCSSVDLTPPRKQFQKEYGQDRSKGEKRVRQLQGKQEREREGRQREREVREREIREREIREREIREREIREREAREFKLREREQREREQRSRQKMERTRQRDEDNERERPRESFSSLQSSGRHLNNSKEKDKYRQKINIYGKQRERPSLHGSPSQTSHALYMPRRHKDSSYLYGQPIKTSTSPQYRQAQSRSQLTREAEASRKTGGCYDRRAYRQEVPLHWNNSLKRSSPGRMDYIPQSSSYLGFKKYDYR